jgi:hypothetical protein
MIQGNASLAQFIPGGGEIPLYASYGKAPLPPEQFFLEACTFLFRLKCMSTSGNCRGKAKTFVSESPRISS